MSSLKALEIEFAFVFHPFGNPDLAFLVCPKPGKHGKPRKIREFEKLSKSQGNYNFCG